MNKNCNIRTCTQ